MEPSDDEMTADDVVRFLEVVEGYGVDSVKFTGGEPMLRQDLEEIVERTPDSMEVSLTTNGTFLPGARGPEGGRARARSRERLAGRARPGRLRGGHKSGAYERAC